MKTQIEALKSLLAAWPHIVSESRQVLGSEQHYQAMLYHCVRQYGEVPFFQVGMNVKQYIENPVTANFQIRDLKKNKAYQGGFEPTPDLVIFKSDIDGDWRRRNREQTLVNMLLALEMKCSEREGSRLAKGEILTDIQKLDALREETRHRGGDVLLVMMVIDTAPKEKERITEYSLGEVIREAKERDVLLFYLSQDREISPKPPGV